MLARFLFYLYQTRKNLELPIKKIELEQLKNFKMMIRHAYENVPLYHRKYKLAGIKINEIKSINEISKLPIITKEDVQSNIQGVITKNINLNKCSKKTTSGSTGNPLTIIIDKRAEDLENVLWLRAAFSNGLTFRDKRTIIGDPRSFPKENWIRYFKILRKNHISIFYSAEKTIRMLNNFRPDVLQGYPSSLAVLTDEYRKNPNNFNPRLIFTLAESLDGVTRELITDTFKAELFDFYGSSECGLIAWECKKHSGYHMNSDKLVIEFIKEGESVSNGERGEIVCTNLINYAMPLIRYNLGDIGIPSKDPCECGINLPMMSHVEGRADDLLTSTDGRIISPSVFFPYPFSSMDGIKQFKVIQERRNKLTIELVINENFIALDKFLQKAAHEIKKLFGEDMEVEFKFSDKIEKNSNGKLRKIISRVPIHLK